MWTSSAGTTITAENATLPAVVVPVDVLKFREQMPPDARRTLDYFRDDGVELKVISEDDPRTVAAIARTVRLDVGDGYDAGKLPADPRLLEKVMADNTVFGWPIPAATDPGSCAGHCPSPSPQGSSSQPPCWG